MPRKQIEISVEDSSRMPITNQEAESAGRALSLYTVSSDVMRRIQDLGVQVQAAGVVKVADGFSFMTADCIANTMLTLTKLSEEADGKELHNIARSLGYLANAMARQTKEMKSSAPAAERVDKPGTGGSGFRPGVAVNMVVQGNVKVEDPNST